MDRFFVYTGEQFVTCETREEAIRIADEALDDWRGCCDPEWPDEVTNVCWGEIRGACEEEITTDADDPTTEYYSYSIVEQK